MDASFASATTTASSRSDQHPSTRFTATPMQMQDIPFGTTDWSTVEETTHAGDSGEARWRTRQFGTVRVRMVEYSAGYRANHWCEKGHILLCLAGELDTELADGRT